jgi:GTP-binding protein HflX
MKEMEFVIPYSDQKMAAFLHRNAKVLEEDYRDEGTYIKALVDEETINKCSDYII